MPRLGRPPRSIFLLKMGSKPRVRNTKCFVPWACFKLNCTQTIMAITKAKKETILSKLEGVKGEAESIVFVKFNGMTVAATTAMREELRQKGVGYFVAKKTLMKRTFGEAFTGSMPQLDGEIAIAYSTEAIAPAQNIKEFASKYKNNLAIVGGVFQGVFKNQAEMTEIASIPSLQVLRGMFAQLINSPRQRFAVVLSKVAETKS